MAFGAGSPYTNVMPPRLKDAELSERVAVIVPASLLQRIEDWRRKQPSIPSKSEAIRLLLEEALRADDQP